MSDPHIGFIVAAYAVASATIGVMIGWVVLEFPTSERPTGSGDAGAR